MGDLIYLQTAWNPLHLNSSLLSWATQARFSIRPNNFFQQLNCGFVQMFCNRACAVVDSSSDNHEVVYKIRPYKVE